MMGDECCRIERAANGFTVTLRDPEIVKQNRASDGPSKRPMPYRDPNVSYVFDSVEKVLTFLEKSLAKALPLDEYTTTFTKALKETDDDD